MTNVFICLNKKERKATHNARHAQNMNVYCRSILRTHSYTYIYIFINGSDSGLSPVRHQAMMWTNDGLLFQNTTIFISELHLNMSFAKFRPFCSNRFDNFIFFIIGIPISGNTVIISERGTGPSHLSSQSTQNIGPEVFSSYLINPIEINSLRNNLWNIVGISFIYI